jgi:hypothetical protein
MKREKENDEKSLSISAQAPWRESPGGPAAPSLYSPGDALCLLRGEESEAERELAPVGYPGRDADIERHEELVGGAQYRSSYEDGTAAMEAQSLPIRGVAGRKLAPLGGALASYREANDYRSYRLEVARTAVALERIADALEALRDDYRFGG